MRNPLPRPAGEPSLLTGTLVMVAGWVTLTFAAVLLP